ncbi:Ribonucleases P/MRP protein subunit pop1 [Ophidiomyces ophidiicola]|nr:Ribonucleases P/MRP protein subunit pop1 [Ophidiomyces ophidiicola]
MAPPSASLQDKKRPPTNREKRKTSTNPAGRARKRVKIQDARKLAAQSSDAALSKTGELDVSAFVAARQFEIKALEAGIQSARNALTTRAFQKVPRNLRRRTASHNVKRVPSRLRARARREMIEDNTPTVTARRRKPTTHLRLRLERVRRLQSLNTRSKEKRQAKKVAVEKEKPSAEHTVNIAPRIPKIKKNKISHPEKPASKYRKRQRTKTWLPTHIFHAKRARMTEPKAPLWRFALPLTPTEKCYRPTHRASGSRGAIAWDMSYMSTIGLEGARESIEGLLKSMGVDGDTAWGSKGKKWRLGTRTLDTWLFERDGEKSPIAPVTLIWAAQNPEDVGMSDAATSVAKKRPKQKMFLRVHPSSFLQLWEELLRVSKIQKPPVMVEDLRFEIGSIEISGPGATEALCAALEPIPNPQNKNKPAPEDVWRSLAGVTNAASLPLGAILAFSASDPRLHYPPRTMKPQNSPKNLNALALLLSSWPLDKTQLAPELFSRPSRLLASRSLSSQKAINRRKALAPPGEYPQPQPADPKIPVIIFASRLDSSSEGISSGHWTILLPWKCVGPVWYSIMYYPLASGGNPRFGGVHEKQQVIFESGMPWFPGDFPGTKSGWAWEIQQRELQKDKWQRKPKGKRVEFDSVDLGKGRRGEIGRGWACDWERLVTGTPSQGEEKPIGTSSGLSEKSQTQTDGTLPTDIDLPTNCPMSPIEIRQLAPATASHMLEQRTKPGKPSTQLPSKFSLATVCIRLLNRGNVYPRSRIYRLPTTDLKLRNRWLSLLCPSSSPYKPNIQKRLHTQKGRAEERIDVPSLKELLSMPALDEEPGQKISPPIPDEVDLIGFITTGNYNLSAGKGTGVGAILVDKVQKYIPPIDQVKTGTQDSLIRLGKEKLMRLCILRPPGENVGRLCFWSA